MLRCLIITVLTLGVLCNDTSGSLSVDSVPNAVYVWNQPGEGDWQQASSWSPARTTPTASDVLVFNAGGTTTATNVPIQTIGQLIVFGNTTVNLQSAAAISLTIAGGDGDDLAIASNSALNFNGANAIACDLVTGTTASINGSMTVSSSGSAAHRLTAVDAGAVNFKDGAVFTADMGFAGNAFGTSNLNSVMFDAGSTYVSIAGGDPFGAVEPESVVIFKKGSLFSLQGNVLPSLSGRTYSHFEVNYPGGIFRVFGAGAFSVDDLKLVRGILDLYLSGDVKGDITISSGCQLDFLSGTTRLNGSTAQHISGRGPQGAGGGSTLIIDNPNGIVLDHDRPLSVWNLQLVNGVVTVTDPTWWISVGGSVTRTNGYVDGYMSRLFFAPGSFMFDTGTENAYSPVSVDVSSGTFPTSLTMRAVQGPHPNIIDSRFALSRYWQIVGPPVVADLTFFYSDPLDIPATANETNFVIQRYKGAFTQPGGSVDTIANTFRVEGVSDFDYVDWTLAEPRALVTPSPTPTPATPTPTPTPTPNPTPAESTLFDFDGDGKADLSIFRPSAGEWYYQRSSSGVTNGFGFGSATDRVTPADFTGDGKTDIGFWRESTGEWYVLRSEDSTFYAFPFGASGDIPAPADYDGDSRADAAVYRPSAQTWFILKSTGGVLSVPFGLPNDIPVPADYDGDGMADVGIYRPDVGQWWNLRSSNGNVFAATFGASTDKPVAGDYTGDGKADVAFYRPAEGSWYVLRSEDFTYYAFPFGNSTDKPAPADYDGDGKFDAAVFRPSDTNWYILKSTGGIQIQQFGAANDIPLPGAFVP